MAFSMKENESLDPRNIRVFRAPAVMTDARRGADAGESLGSAATAILLRPVERRQRAARYGDGATPWRAQKARSPRNTRNPAAMR